MSTTQPRYKVVAPGGYYANGQLYSLGAEMTFAGWPRHGLEPLNAGAQRIHRYYTKHQAAWGGLPPSPYSATHGSFYLPGMSLQFDHAEPPGLVHDHEGDASLPTLPEYQLTMPRWIAKREFQAGERVHWIGWPSDDMTPVNHPARQVAAYFAEHRAHPQLEKRGCWNWYSGLHLPKLQRQKPRVQPPAENVGAIASEVEMATGQPGTRGGLHVGVGQLRPYADPQHKHLFRNVVSTGVNRAKPLPDRTRTLPDRAKSLASRAQE